MTGNIDAVIAALRTELQQAERSDDYRVKSHHCNRWIRQLPGGWLRWRNLLIRSEYEGEVRRQIFITHVKATIAYLETIRDDAAPTPSLWSSLFGATRRPPEPAKTPEEPIDAEFTDVSTPPTQKKLPKPKIVK